MCHWPAQFHGSHLIAHARYASDRENTAQTTALVLHVGGPEAPTRGHAASGIHWHIDPRNEIRYRHVDARRQEIAEVVLTTAEGEVRFTADGADETAEEGDWRTMDCLDCHNRPTHIYQLPHRAVDKAMASGALDASIPWLRREGERVLRDTQPGDRTATVVAEALRTIYAEEHPDDLAALEGQLDEVAAALDQDPRTQHLAGHEHHLGHLCQQSVAFRCPRRFQRGRLLPLPQRRAGEC